MSLFETASKGLFNFGGPIGVASSIYNVGKKLGDIFGGDPEPYVDNTYDIQQNLNTLLADQNGEPEGREELFVDLMNRAGELGANDIADQIGSYGQFEPFSDSAMGTVAQDIFNTSNNNQRTPGTMPTPPTEPTPAITVEDQIQNVINSAGTPTEIIEQIGEIYGDDTQAAQETILREANNRGLTAEQISDAYDPDRDGEGFPTTMPNNQDAMDILSRSPIGGPPGAFDADGQVPGTGLPGSGDPGAGDGPDNGPGGDPGGNPPGDGVPGGNPSGGNPLDDNPPSGNPLGGVINIPSTANIPTNTTGGGMAFSDFFNSSTIKETQGDPDFRQRGLGLFGAGNVNNNLTQRLNQSYTPYSGNRFTGLNADQLAMADMVRNNVVNVPGKDIFDAAKNNALNVSPIGLNNVTGQSITNQSNPLQTSGRRNIQDIVAGQFAGSNLDPYINPYNQQVVDTTLADIERARQMQTLQNDSAASLANAYGGDRAALVNAETNRAALDASARVAADLRSRGFDQAAALYGQDADREMEAAVRNQAADTTTTRDAMSIAAQLEANNQQQQRLADSQTQLNNLAAGDNLLAAFDTGSDAYRSYLGDYDTLAGTLDARDQRALDFNFDEFLAAQDYDQSMIDNMIRLFAYAPRNSRTVDTVDRGFAADLGGAIGLADDVNDVYQAGKGFLGGIFGNNDADFGAYPNARYGG